MTNRKTSSVAKSRRRFWQVPVRHGQLEMGACCQDRRPCRHRFSTVEAAVQDWVTGGWGLEEELRPECPGFDLSKALVAETGLIIDLDTRRVIRVVTYRQPVDFLPGMVEIAKPLAMIFDPATGAVETVRAEDYQEQAA